MSTTADHLSDPELLETEWDLAPLVDGEGDAGVERQLDQATDRADGFRRALRGQDRRARRGRARTRRCTSSRRSTSWSGKAGSYASLRFATDTADPARGALLQLDAGARDRDRDQAAVLRARVGGARRRARRGAARPPRGSSSARHYLRSARRYRPHLLTEPEEKILAEKSISSQSAVGAAVRRARLGPAGRARRRRRAPLDVALERPAGIPTARRRQHRRGGLRSARAGTAHAGVHLQHARPRQVGRGPAAPLPPLAGRPQPLQRGLRRVGDGADRGRPQPLRHPAALVSAEGQAARRRPARRLRPRRAGAPRGHHVLVRRGPRARARHLRVVLARGRARSRAGSSTSTGSTRPSGPTSAAARSAPTPSRASTPTCCSTSPPAAATC